MAEPTVRDPLYTMRPQGRDHWREPLDAQEAR
jgi:hypothetical protein